MLRVALDACFACKTSTTTSVGWCRHELNEKPEALGASLPLSCFVASSFATPWCFQVGWTLSHLSFSMCLHLKQKDGCSKSK
jgi:hypothetical protein